MPTNSSTLRDGRPSKQYADRLCLVCGRPFVARVRRGGPTHGRFCSLDCFYLDQYGRFEDRLSTQRVIDDETGCWIWTGDHYKNGYGRIYFAGRQRRLHRVAMHLWRGFDLASELDILHRCDRPACFNPDHLSVGTATDNGRDMMSKGRHFRGETTPWARLTDAAVLDIRARFAAGESQRSIGQDYGIPQQTVSDIVRRKSWKHVD